MKYLTRKEELLLIAIYKLKEDAYLVKIREHLNKQTDKEWSIGNVYVPLDRMESWGYLKSWIGEPTAKRGGKAIKYYKVTELGRTVLQEIKKLQDTVWEGLDDLAPEKD